MNTKVKILISLSSLEDLNYPVDGYVIGYDKFSLFANEYFSFEEIKDIKKKNQIYILFNALINEERLEEVIFEINRLIPLGFNFIVSDVGLLELIKERSKDNIIIYQPYTLISNRLDYQTYQELLCENLGISPFIKEDDLIELSSLKGSFITALGYLPLYQSHRKIISTYLDYHHLNLNDKKLYLKEEFRDDLYPIVENFEGSSIFKSSPISLLSNINKYKASFIYLDFTFLNDFKRDVIDALSSNDLNRLKELENKMGVKNETY